MVLMAACKPGTPSQYIQPDKMEDILVDYHLAQSLAQHETSAEYGRDYNRAIYLEAVLKKYGVTKADFDSSLVYYYTRADRFEAICQHVSERLDEMALIQGASEGEIGKYAHYNATGDTANVWPDRTTALLMPMPPYNRWDFAIEADSTYRRGDQLMMMFMSDFMYQTGSKNAIVYLAVDYGDTVVSRNLRFSVTGLTQLRVPEDTTRRISSVKGFIYLDGGNEPSTSTRLLFLNNVQLIRFHTIDDDTDLPADSIPRGGDAGRLMPDTVSRGDSIRGSDAVLPADGGAALHPMDAGADSVKER